MVTPEAAKHPIFDETDEPTIPADELDEALREAHTLNTADPKRTAIELDKTGQSVGTT